MRISSERKIYSMGPGNKPAAVVNPGDTVIFETRDCYDGMVISPIDEENKIDKSRINPATGPVYIDGAEPGDTLKVEILKIALKGKGIMRISPKFGVLMDKVEKSLFKIVDVCNEKICFNEKWVIPVKPMVGVIGTSPLAEYVENESPGNHGGNMDARIIKEGSIVYLPVNVKGGLLAIGDIHACMGDGEVSGTGVEISAEVAVKVEVLKNTNQKRPYVETEKAFYTVCSASTLEEASKLAVEDAVDMIMSSTGASFEDAYMMTSLVCNLIICQVVDPLMTVRMEIPKSLFFN